MANFAGTCTSDNKGLLLKHYLPVSDREFSDFPNGLNMSWSGLSCSLE